MKQTQLELWPGTPTNVLVSITSFIAVLLALGTSELELSEIVMVAILVTSYTFSMFLFASLAASKVRKFAKYSILLLLSLLIFIGSTRGFLIFELTKFFDQADPISLSTRVLNSTITICVWGFIYSLIEARLKAFSANYRRDFANRAFELAASGAVSEAEIANSIDQMQSIQELQANLRQIATSAPGTGFSHSQLIAAARRIRSEIETSLRPLSHRIWFDSSAAQPKFHVVELLKEALRNLDIKWLPTSALIIFAFLVGALSIYEPLAVFIRVGFYGVALILLLLLLERSKSLLQGSATKGAFALIGIALVSNLVGEVAVSILLYGQLLTTDPLLALAGPATTFGILWVEASFAQMRKDWGAVDSAMSSKAIEDPQAIINSRFAGYLHNTLQSQLAGIALALESTDPNDREKISELMGRLKVISSQSIGADFASQSHSSIEKMEELAKAWSGITNVRLSIDSSLIESSKLQLAVELVEEAISNAVRHSQASEIQIGVRAASQGIAVEILHPANSRKSGKGSLGQLWLDQFSQQHSVEYTEDGKRRLTVIL